MSQRIHKDLKQILHPYMFVLKEGVEFQNDCLNYSLMMLHVNCLEVLGSPYRLSPSQDMEPSLPLLDVDPADDLGMLLG